MSFVNILEGSIRTTAPGESSDMNNGKKRTTANQPPLTTYYANAKLFSRRIRKRPIKKVSGLTKRVSSED